MSKKDEYIQKEKLIRIIRFNKPFIFKNEYNSVIPFEVYQTWHSKDLPPLMRSNLERLKCENPRFNFNLYDDNDCREFIKNNFSDDVLNAYNALVPGAYKADLWRLCVLYKNGGIYLDIRNNFYNGFRLIDLTENEHYCYDRPRDCIYNSIMVSKKDSIFLLKCIEEIIDNVKNSYYGNGSLDPTGPGLLGKVIKKYNFKLNIDMFKPREIFDLDYVIYKDTQIMKGYDGYCEERKQYSIVKHYGYLWENRQIYNKYLIL